MKIFKSIPWETRNLGVPSYELNTKYLSKITSEILAHEVEDLQNKYNKLFIFARLQKKEIRYATILEHQGFYIIESTVSPYMNLNKNEALGKFIDNNISYIPKRYKQEVLKPHTLTHDEKHRNKHVLKKIAEESFAYDRFHLDQNCSAEVADCRFSLWVEDLISDTKVTFDVLQLNDEVIGFIAKKENYLILGGFKKKYLLAGFGGYFILSTCSILKEQNYPVAKTLVSINNLLIVNLYAGVGFKFEDTRYSFHFWS